MVISQEPQLSDQSLEYETGDKYEVSRRVLHRDGCYEHADIRRLSKVFVFLPPRVTQGAMFDMAMGNILVQMAMFTPASGGLINAMGRER
jgi:hypothetical protein